MPFTRVARTEAQTIRDHNVYDKLIYDGWCESNVPAELLDELQIPYEVMFDTSAYVPGAQVFAPFWVFGVWYNAGMPLSTSSSRWNAVKSLLTVTRDSTEEQRMVAAELILEGSLPPSAKAAANNLADILSGKRRKVEDDIEHA